MHGRNQLTIALALALTLSACGGGGGGNIRPTPPPTNPPPTTPQPPIVQEPLPEYSQHIVASNAQGAHDAGLTGEGVVIGVVDSGVNHEHPALQGRVTDNLIYVDSSNDLSVDDAVGHGTAVAQIIAGQAFGRWPGGIAPGAEIVSARIISDQPPDDDGSGQGNEVEGALGLAPIHQDLIDRGVQVMNNSWGGIYWTNPDATTEIAAEYRPFIDNGGLVVFATGNESEANPSSIAALPSQEGPSGSLPAADLEKGWLAVAALDGDNTNQLASYSNACGVAMNYCLAALGDVVTTGTDDPPVLPSYWLWSGTSLAAPQVTGAAALVWEAFPYFDNDLVRQTLLGGARDLGATGVDPVFGYGALDVQVSIQGPSKFDWGDVSVSFDDITSVWSNNITGAGGLTKNGTGTLTIAAPANLTYAGDTAVVGGTLDVDGLLQSPVTVGANGNLTGSGDITATVTNNGTVTVQGATNLSVDGYHQTADGTLAVDLGNHLVVNGSAQLDGGDLHVLGIKDGYVTQSRETVLSSSTLAGQFDELTVASGVFLTATLGYDAANAWLDISSVSVASVQGLNYTSARAASATRVDNAMKAIDKQIASAGKGAISGSFIAAAGDFQRAPTLAAAEASLSSLSGELHAAADAMTYEGIDASRRALSARFDDLGERGFAAGLWRHDLAQRGGLSRTGFNGFDYDLSGSMTGLDLRIGQRGLLGVAASHAQGSGWLDHRGDRSRSRQNEGQIYAGLVGENGYLQGRLGFGRFDRKVDRDILLGRRQTGAVTAYSGDYDVAHVEAGWRRRFGEMRLTPYVASQYARIQNDGFVESGADGFGLKVNANTSERWQAIAGLRGNRDWRFANGLWLGLEARAEWQETLAARGTGFDASFVGVDQWQTVAGIGLADRSRLFGIGFDFGFSPDSKLRLDLSRRQASNLEDDQASLQYVVGF